MAAVPNQQINMDQSTQQSFVRFFQKLPEKPSSTIRFFNRSDYYTLHGSDALFAAEQVFKSKSVCKMLGAEPYKTEGLILNKNHFEAFVRDLLLVKQYRVEVYVNQGSSKNQDWVLEYKGSPGNLSQFEEVLFGNTEIAVGVSVIAVKLGTEGKSRVVGLSCVDVMSSLFSVTEFQDDETFSNLETLIVTLAPKECLLIQGEGSREFENLKTLMERSNVTVTLRKKSEFSSETVIEDLNSLLKFQKGQQKNARSLAETNLELAMCATAALIKYLDLLSESGNEGQFGLTQIQQSRYIKLDSAALKALNVEHRPGEIGVGSAPSSILALLDKCRTPQGHRLIAQWVRQPLRDLTLIKERHDVVEILVNDNELRTSLGENYLRRIPDLQHLSKKLASKKANLQDCYKIYLCTAHLPVLLEALTSACRAAGGTSLKGMICEPLKELIHDMEKYQELVEETIDLEAVEKGDFMIRPEFDEDCKEIRESMEEIEERIQKQLKKASDDLHLDSGKMKLESNQQFGYYFRITLKDEQLLRNNRNYKSYKTIDSNKSGVRFRNNKLEELNEDYLAAREKYVAKEKELIDQIISIAAGYSGTVKAIGGVLATLDVLTAFASAALCSSSTYVRPKMLPSDEGQMKLLQVRHPCLEAQPDMNFIANDVEFKSGECTFHIITGPNMGGKSTYVRSVGVAALLAHIGSFVPCDSATVSLLDAILARIGSDDSQLKGLSTFMNEMVETAAILRTATANSLVIIDELGRGTSTYDGCGIAWSIAAHLAKEVKAFCLFATHFHEITRLADEVPTVRNQHVTAIVSDDKLALLYKVQPGVCDQSFGIHVARMANFPEDVVEFAKKKQSQLENCHEERLGTTFQCPDDEPIGKKKKIIEEAEKFIDEFEEKFKEIDPLLPPSEIKSRVEKLKKEYLEKENPYLRALIMAGN